MCAQLRVAPFCSHQEAWENRLHHIVGPHLGQEREAFCTPNPVYHWLRGAPGSGWGISSGPAVINLLDLIDHQLVTAALDQGEELLFVWGISPEKENLELSNTNHGELMEHEHLLRNYIARLWDVTTSSFYILSEKAWIHKHGHARILSTFR